MFGEKPKRTVTELAQERPAQEPDLDCMEVVYKNPNVFADISGLTLGAFEDRFEVYLRRQVQEMMRAERIVDDAAIQHEIDTYGQLLPAENQLSATMFIELTEAGRIRDEITRFLGINTGEHIYLMVGDERVPGDFEAGQSDDRRISAVQYVRFSFTEQQKRRFTGDPACQVRLVIEHPNYSDQTELSAEVREELGRDLSAV